MKKLIAVFIAVIALSIPNITMVFADGNPYEPHIPVPTGLDGVSIFYILAGIIFVVGMGFLTTAKILKRKLSLK